METPALPATTAPTRLRERRIAATAYAIYLALLAFALLRHEPWADELHSWNIAKASGSFPELLHNIRYEGHPPLWFALLAVLSSFSTDPAAMQGLQFCVAGLAAFLILFRAPFPLAARLIIPFGYYFLYEYGVFSRSYGLATLLVLCMLAVLPMRTKRLRLLLYYGLLFLLANTLLVSAVLAASIHLYVLLQMYSNAKSRRSLIAHGILGGVALLPAIYVVFPPADSELNMDFWLHRWDFQQLKSAFVIPLRALMPVPAPWEHHFWNTHCLLQIQDPLRILRGTGYLLSVLLGLAGAYILKAAPRCRLLFGINTGLTIAMGLLLPLTNARYVGFVFLGFIAAAWLHQEHRALTGKRKTAFYGLLVLQLAGSLVAVPRDLRQVFSNAFRVPELLAAVPPGAMVATDYFCLTAAAAYGGQPFYAIETNKPAYFLLWNQDMTRIDARKDRYVRGAGQLFRETGRNEFYLLSMNAPELIPRTDTAILRTYQLRLAAKREGAIEKFSNLYLYRISR